MWLKEKLALLWVKNLCSFFPLKNEKMKSTLSIENYSIETQNFCYGADSTKNTE